MIGLLLPPEGITKSPNDTIYENFQVLGFVIAPTKETAVGKLKEYYPYLDRSGFDEVWIYQLRSRNPHITYLGIDQAEDEFDDEFKREIVFDFFDENSYFFEAYSDAFQEIRVDVKDEMIEVYDRYIAEKHLVHFGDYKL
jgi:hypothetical protein